MALIACDCSVDVDDYPDIYLPKIVTARKPHKCCECREMINPGQKYERTTLLFDDHWNTYKTCVPCLRVRNHYCANGFYFGMLRERIIECLGFDYTEVPEEDEDE